MTQSNKVLFFGNERLATGVTTNTPILSQLVLNGYIISAIVITPQHHKPSRKPRLLEVEAFAAKHNIPLVEISDLKSSLGLIKSYEATLGILAAYGKIVPQAVIDAFPLGIINLHPSLLPKHRGPLPIEAPILDNEQETGISIMKLVAAMDAGPIYGQEKITLNGTETKQELANKLGDLGAKKLISLLPGIIDGSIAPQEQAESATYDKKINQQLSILDFYKPASTLEREIRAYQGWPRSKTTINGQAVTITKARYQNGAVSDPGAIIINNNDLGIGTTNGILLIERLIPSGSKEMTGAEFIRGYLL